MDIKRVMNLLEKILIFLGLFFFAAPAFSVNTEIGGVVRDSVTKETLPYTSVYFESTDVGTAADVNGTFELTTDESGYLVFSMMGYQEKKIYINADGRKKTLICSQFMMRLSTVILHRTALMPWKSVLMRWSSPVNVVSIIRKGIILRWIWRGK